MRTLWSDRPNCSHKVSQKVNVSRAFVSDVGRERKLNTNFFFSNFSGPGISRQNPGISRPKSLISLVSRDVSNFLGPTRSRGRPLPHWKISGPKSLGLGSFFLPEIGRTPRGSCNRTLLRRVLRVSIETEVLRRVLRRGGGGYRRRFEGA